MLPKFFSLNNILIDSFRNTQMLNNFSKYWLPATIFLILVTSASVTVLAENDLTLEQIKVEQSSIVIPKVVGVGEGVSPDGRSEVSSQYLEYPRNQSSYVSSTEVGAFVANGCNCVIFRMDDLQDFFVNTVQVAIMDEFTSRGEFLSIGPIFNDFANGIDTSIVDTATAGVTSGLFEVFVHGWNHTDFSTFNLEDQTNQLQLAQDKAELIFGSNTTFFVPPFNAYNTNSTDAMVATDFETISSEGIVDPDPDFVADGISNIVDSRGLYHLPSDAKFIDFGENPPARILNSQILDDIDTSIALRGYAVVTLHAQDHAQTFPNGTYINAPNATLMNDLEIIIDGVKLKNYPIRTFGQVIAYNGNISIGNVTKVEGNSGTSNFVFDVTRTSTSGTMSVDYTTQNNSASSSSDYVLTSGTLNFLDGGLATLPITVPVNGDNSVESDETFFVNLSNCIECNIVDSQGLGTITNDDVNVSIGNIAATEGNSGSKFFNFTVTRSENLSDMSVDYQTSDGTATVSNTDYTLSSGTLNFAQGGSPTQTIQVPVSGDNTVESDEGFFVNLSNCIGCMITDAQGEGTITNDDANISIDNVPQVEGNSGTSNFVFTVTRTNNIALMSVDYQTADNTATQPSDYTSKSGTLNFAKDGPFTDTIEVSVKGDVIEEANEMFFVNLSNCVGCTITNPQGVGTIKSECEPLPVSGPWTIFTSCILENNFTSPDNIIVQNGAVLTIPSSVTLSVPPGNNITIISGGGVLIESGGSLSITS